MRKELEQRDGRRGTFTATFERFGSKPAYKGPPIVTLLFVDVRDASDKVVADHLWFKTALCWERADLKPGELVQFDARVREYWKGYRGHRDEGEGLTKDYGLRYPKNDRELSRKPEAVDQLPLFSSAQP